MAKPLEVYFSLRQKHVFNYLHEFELQGNEAALHDFRVELKKLRALFKFLRSVYSKQKLKKADHKIRAIFLEAGEIREYQQIQQWLMKHKLHAFDKDYLPLIRLTAITQQFQQLAAKHKRDLKEVFDETSKWISITNEILAEQYRVSLHAQIIKSLQSTPNQKDWHDLRKLIKQWLYAQSWVIIEKEDGDSALFNRIQESIGHWHDFVLIKETLLQKQIFLSKDLTVQKDYSRACSKLEQAIKNKEKQVINLLALAASPEIVTRH